MVTPEKRQGCCKNKGENEDITSIPLVPQPFHILQSTRNNVSQPPSCPGFCCKNNSPEVPESLDFFLHHLSISTDSLSKDSVESSNLSLISTIPLGQIYCFHLQKRFIKQIITFIPTSYLRFSISYIIDLEAITSPLAKPFS